MLWEGGIWYKKSTIVIVILLLTLTIGISFAYWQRTLNQENKNLVESNCFELTLTEKDDIHLEKAYPIVDEEGKNLTPYEFTITNTCESFSNYQINLEVLDTTTFEDLSYMKVMLDDKVSLLTENEETTKTLENAKTSYKLRTGYLKENASRTYRLRLWMDENTPTDKAYMKKVFESKITIVANYLENLDNQIIAEATSLNERYGREESFSIHVTSEKYNLVAMSEDLEHWEEFETKGKEVNFEKTYTENGTHKYYFMDEVDNVSDVNVNVTKIDDKKPIADIKVLKQDNLITVNAGASIDNETSVVKYYYSRDGENFIESNESVYKFSEYNYGLATKMLTEYLGWKVYVKVEDEVGNISDVIDYTISNTEGSLAYDGTVDNNLRYVGATPNNYVSFNNELWRIIGVRNNVMDADGNLETKIKLIRAESIGNDVIDQDRSKHWAISSLQNTLNGTYYNNFSFFDKSMVDEEFWNVAVVITSSDYGAGIPQYYYENERGNVVFQGSEKKWYGKIALPYPSDYGFAVGGTSTNRQDCLKMMFSEWGYKTCHTNSWVHKDNMRFLTPAHSVSGYYYLTQVNSTGSLWFGSNTGSSPTYPTLYLKQTVKITSGIGTSSNPFILSLN